MLLTCDRATEPHMQPIANRELVAIFANVITDGPLSPPPPPQPLVTLGIQASRCARCTTTMQRSTKSTHATRGIRSHLVSQFVQTSAAHQQRANVRSAAAGCQPHSFAGNAVALQPKAPCSKMPDHCVASRNMRFAEYRLCAQPPVVSSNLSAVKVR